MTVEQDIAAISDGGANTAAEVRTALQSVLGFGPVLSVAQTGLDFSANTDVADAGRGYAIPLQIPGIMYVRSFSIVMSTGATGTYQWGLFDYSSDPTAATKVAGGSGAPGSTGWNQIAADAAPVTIDPGNYILIMRSPSSNVGVWHQYVTQGAPAGMGIHLAYTWTDTPNLTAAGWTQASAMVVCRLIGDLDGSGNQW